MTDETSETEASDNGTPQNNNATLAGPSQVSLVKDAQMGTSSKDGSQATFQFEQFADFMKQQGLLLVPAKQTRPQEGKGKKISGGSRYNHKQDGGEGSKVDSGSEITVYKNAVLPVNRGNSSSEDDTGLDTSDKTGNNLVLGLNGIAVHNNERSFIAEDDRVDDQEPRRVVQTPMGDWHYRK